MYQQVPPLANGCLVFAFGLATGFIKESKQKSTKREIWYNAVVFAV